MKQFLKEFISEILLLNEARTKGPERPPGSIWKGEFKSGKEGKWYAKSNSGKENKGGFISQADAQRWLNKQNAKESGVAPTKNSDTTPTTKGKPGRKPNAQSTGKKITDTDTQNKSGKNLVATGKVVSARTHGTLENTNLAQLALQIQGGIIAPGNAYSKYAEAVSIAAGKKVADSDSLSDEDLMETIIQLDCGSKTFTNQVTADIEKEHRQQYNELKETGVFSRGCDTKYTEAQNQARFITMLAAREKGNRIQRAIAQLGVSGVSIDAFSGDEASITNMKNIVNSSTAKIYTETGEELSRERALSLLNSFGKSKFPADTALIGTDDKGNLLFMGFSDKKDLNAIMGNSTPNAEFDAKRNSLNVLRDGGQITEEQYKQLTEIVDRADTTFAKLESGLRTLTTEPSNILFEKLGDTKFVDDCIARAKTIGKTPGKYWLLRIEIIRRDALKKQGSKAQIEAHKWLTAAGWDGRSEITDKLTFKAWVHSVNYTANNQTDEHSLHRHDQRLLIGLEIIPKTKIIPAVSKIRKATLAILTKLREESDAVTIGNTGVGVGTLMDATIAFHQFHLDIGKFDGALTMVAGDTVVDSNSIAECSGISSAADFAKRLTIETKQVKDRELGVVTGENIELFMVNDAGIRIRIGSRSIRSKQGSLGKLETTFRYHKQFQSCLKSKRKK
jgi:hypothetical protein